MRLRASQRAYLVACHYRQIAEEGRVPLTSVALTTNDVAKRQGVSKPTAWRVLNWMTEKGMVEREEVWISNKMHVQYWPAEGVMEHPVRSLLAND